MVTIMIDTHAFLRTCISQLTLISLHKLIGAAMADGLNQILHLI